MTLVATWRSSRDILPPRASGLRAWDHGFFISRQTNYLSGGPFLRGFGVFGDPRVNNLNVIRDYWLHDAQLRFDPTKKITVYFNVDNIFDRKPQLLPGAIFGTPTGLETAPDMDVFGRRFLAGVRVKFL